MSVNTGAKQFRKVDVDQYDEERFEDDTGDDNSVDGPNDGEVNTLLGQYPFQHIITHDKEHFYNFFLRCMNYDQGMIVL